MSPVYRFQPQRGLFSRLLSAAILLAAVTASLLLGTVLFLVILGAIVLLSVALYLHFWWLRRSASQSPRRGPGGGVTLEGEYTVSKRPRDEDR